MRTDVNACKCTRGCMDTVRKSALKFDSGRKIPCHTRESNLHQRRAGPMFYQLSHIPTPTYTPCQCSCPSCAATPPESCCSVYHSTPKSPPDLLHSVKTQQSLTSHGIEMNLGLHKHSHPQETAEHYLLHCITYHTIRATTFFTLPTDQIDIGTLLYGDPNLQNWENEQIFLTVHDFIN